MDLQFNSNGISWSIDQSEWLLDRSIGMIDWSIGKFIDHLDNQFNQLSNWLMIDQLNQWLIDQSIEWLIDRWSQLMKYWLLDRFIYQFLVLFQAHIKVSR